MLALPAVEGAALGDPVPGALVDDGGRGEPDVLGLRALLSVALAVAALTAVGFLTDRIGRAVARQANEVLERPCELACADAGFANTEELEKIDAQDIRVIVPSQRQALHEGEKPFSKSEFTYDSDKDCYYCPWDIPCVMLQPRKRPEGADIK